MKQNSLIKNEYRRNLFSYKTLVFLLILILLTSLNFYFSYIEKTALINQLNNPEEDINFDVLQNWVLGYNGFEFLFKFYNMSDEFQVGIMLIFAWMSIFLSSELAKQRASGCGNLLVIRFGYYNYSKSVLTAQSLYIATMFIFAMFIQIIFAFLIGGADTLYYESANRLYSLSECVFIIFILYLLIVLFCISINIIAASCLFVLHNVYFIQELPLLGFALLPSVILAGLSNIAPFIGYLQFAFVPTHYLSYIVRLTNFYNKNELCAFDMHPKS